ncbi:hypothetical protein E2C01_063665 [Portunus trituberculatus]|uniref:Uncharacterized protein n=1 Tax=Portunus trituberculatus TaxID=210409 RepID=A0A5B7HB25_PORTR|nr:hypothetical protein [Portunus trituberculatus]
MQQRQQGQYALSRIQQDSAAHHEGRTHLSPTLLGPHTRPTTRPPPVPSGREGRLRGRHSGGNNPPFFNTVEPSYSNQA